MSDDCLFCQMIDERIDSYTVFENEYAYAFLDINPVTEGHTLVIPKEHAETVMDISSDMIGPFFEAVQRVAAGIEAELEPAGINLLQSNGETAGQEIEHAHVHIVPRYEDDEVTIGFKPGDLDEEEASELEDRLTDVI